MKQSKDYSNKELVRYLILIILITLSVLLTCWYVISSELRKPRTEANGTINDCFITAPNILHYPDLQVLGIKVDETMYAIIYCESRFDPEAKNPTSSARGLLQIIKSSEEFCEKGLGKDLDMYNPEDNILCGKYLMEHGGLVHWEESKNCWLAKM